MREATHDHTLCFIEDGDLFVLGVAEIAAGAVQALLVLDEKEARPTTQLWMAITSFAGSKVLQYLQQWEPSKVRTKAWYAETHLFMNVFK